MLTDTNCANRIFSGERWDICGHPCSRKGTLEHEGKNYCKQHYPPNVVAKKAGRHRLLAAKGDAQEKAQNAIELARVELVRKAAAYDRLVAWLDTGAAGTGGIRKIMDGKRDTA